MQVAATRWTGTQSSFDGYDLNQFEVTASGTQKFRCVWTNELR